MVSHLFLVIRKDLKGWSPRRSLSFPFCTCCCWVTVPADPRYVLHYSFSFLLKVIFPFSSARFLCLTLCCFRTPMGSRDAIYQSPISQQVCMKLLLVVEGDLSAQPSCHWAAESLTQQDRMSLAHQQTLQELIKCINQGSPEKIELIRVSRKEGKGKQEKTRTQKKGSWISDPVY